MESPEAPTGGPDPRGFEDHFYVYEIRRDGEEVRYYGTPLKPVHEMIRAVWPVFHDQGYEVRVEQDLGEWILVAEPIDLGIDGIPWTNVILALATVASTLFAGAFWYQLNPYSYEIIYAWPFAAAIMIVLGVHELGHYVMSRYHRVNASLPYFIPVPTLIGTMGAVIKMKGHIPSRKALFDIGVAGPLAGLFATIVVTVIGLHLPPIQVPASVVEHPDAIRIELGYPLLLEFLSWVTGQPATFPEENKFVNPVVIGGWVGMFVTFLNMIPVGQLDGGHIVRAILGERQQIVGAFVPVALFGLAGYLYFFTEATVHGVMIWGLWGMIAAVFVAVGPAAPVQDEELGGGRILVGVLTFVLGILCFTPLPIQVHM